LRPSGLGARILGALVVTSVVTLAAAALTLVGPLADRLREEELSELASEAGSATAVLHSLSPSELHPRSPVLMTGVRTLGRKADARVIVVGPANRVYGDTDPDGGGTLTDAARALRTNRVVADARTEDGVTDARAAAPTALRGQRYALEMRRSFRDVTSASSVVRRALPVAALSGLAAALGLGLLLTSRLVRRLRTLRDAALRIPEVGTRGEVSGDRSNDEVGDLARAFATMQSRLHDQEEARRRFVATASHELRTPLSSLHLMLDLLDEELAEGGSGQDGARKQVERAGTQVRRLEGLAADLLDLSRLDADVALRREPVDLNEVCAAVASEFDGVPDRPVVRLDRAAEPCSALGDPGAVAQIARILIDNAQRFGPSATDVHVVLGADGLARTIEVVDEGPGVPAGEEQAIFERFRRGDQQDGDGGFGLGLPIARELARRMGGEVALDRTPGRTTFRVTLWSAASVSSS
jgi:signal transduction histidine kinase